MNSLKARLDAFQRSRAGLFVKKLVDDQTPNLASLLAWGTLSAMLPLMLGILSVAGLILRDPETLGEVYSTLLLLVPASAVGPIGDSLNSVRESSAAPAGIVAILLLLFNGSGFFSNLETVFNQAYHVQSRNVVMQRLVALMMLVITAVLLIVAALAAGIGGAIGTVPLGLPIGPVLGQVIGWSIAIVSALGMFVLLYRIVPNANQGWRDVLPGAALSSVLLLVITQIFPLYVKLFPPNHAYAVFGVFLVFTFWLYLLGFVFVLGAELNAFLEQPTRSVALAEATAAAVRGDAQFNQAAGRLRAEATGSAPALRGGGVLGSPQQSAANQLARHSPKPTRPAESAHATRVHPSHVDEAGRVQPAYPDEADRADQPARPSVVGSLAGRVLGFVALILAVLLMRGREPRPSDGRAAA